MTQAPPLFHAVPDAIFGSVLYPLNDLEHVDRETWTRARAKYAGREWTTELRLPPLDCLWNDALHLSTVHPADLFAELEAAGLDRPRRSFFEIDPYQLDAGRTAVFLNRVSVDESRSTPGDDDDGRGFRRETSRLSDSSQWMGFRPTAIATLTQVNDLSREYYRECAAAGTRPLAWAYLPHVFYRGTLNLDSLGIVETG